VTQEAGEAFYVTFGSIFEREWGKRRAVEARRLNVVRAVDRGLQLLSFGAWSGDRRLTVVGAVAHGMRMAGDLGRREAIERRLAPVSFFQSRLVTAALWDRG